MLSIRKINTGTIFEIAMALPFIWLADLACLTALCTPFIKERRVIEFIALSDLALSLFVIFKSVNDAIGVLIYWILPVWICGIVAIVCFHIGLVRPAFIINRFDDG